MLDSITLAPSLEAELLDAPRTLREAQSAWEELRERNQKIRRRYQEAQSKDVLLRSAAMLEAWQS